MESIDQVLQSKGKWKINLNIVPTFKIDSETGKD